MSFVKEAFKSNYIAPLGPQVDAFEREFAEKVGVTRHCVGSWERRQWHITLRSLLAICQEFDVGLEYFIGGKP